MGVNDWNKHILDNYRSAISIPSMNLVEALIWKGLRNGETIYEIMTKEDVLMFYVFGVMLIGFIFFRMKNIKYEDGMS